MVSIKVRTFSPIFKLCLKTTKEEGKEAKTVAVSHHLANLCYVFHTQCILGQMKVLLHLIAPFFPIRTLCAPQTIEGIELHGRHGSLLPEN